jgi:hypothetical protein
MLGLSLNFCGYALCHRGLYQIRHHEHGDLRDRDPDESEMLRRRQVVLDRGLPYLVAELKGDQPVPVCRVNRKKLPSSSTNIPSVVR